MSKIYAFLDVIRNQDGLLVTGGCLDVAVVLPDHSVPLMHFLGGPSLAGHSQALQR